MHLGFAVTGPHRRPEAANHNALRGEAIHVHEPAAVEAVASRYGLPMGLEIEPEPRGRKRVGVRISRSLGVIGRHAVPSAESGRESHPTSLTLVLLSIGGKRPLLIRLLVYGERHAKVPDA